MVGEKDVGSEKVAKYHDISARNHGNLPIADINVYVYIRHRQLRQNRDSLRIVKEESKNTKIQISKKTLYLCTVNHLCSPFCFRDPQKNIIFAKIEFVTVCLGKKIKSRSIF